MTSTAGTQGGTRRRTRRALIVVLATTALSLLACELALRFLLFGRSSLATKLGQNLRNPAFYTAGEETDDYWKLQHLTADAEHLLATPNPDPRVGWTGYAITPGTYEHIDEASIGDRTPVLLYGDSFAQCNTPARSCFQGLLAESDLAERFALVNYGVGGYGLDQIHLLLASSIDRFRDQQPIVIVGVLVDNDLDRSVLSFRCWPKPRLRLDGDRLVDAAPVDTDVARYVAEHPPEITSYLWSLLEHRFGLVPAWLRGDVVDPHAATEEKRALNRKLLAEIHAELERRGLRHFFFLFHGQGSLAEDSVHDWQEPLVRETCRELGVEVGSSRPYLMAAAGGDPARLEPFFGHEGKLLGHYNAMGNAIVFEGLRRAIEGRFDESGVEEIRELVESGRIFELAEREQSRELFGRDARVTTRAEGAVLRWVESRNPPFDEWPEARRLCLRSGEYGSTEIAIELGGTARRLTGLARSVMLPDRPCADAKVELTVEADGRVLFRELVSGDPPGRALDLDLGGVRRLVVRVSSPSGDAGCAWVCLDEPRVD